MRVCAAAHDILSNHFCGLLCAWDPMREEAQFLPVRSSRGAEGVSAPVRVSLQGQETASGVPEKPLPWHLKFVSMWIFLSGGSPLLLYRDPHPPNNEESLALLPLFPNLWCLWALCLCISPGHHFSPK